LDQKKDSNVKVIPPYKPVATDASADAQDKTSAAAAARGEKPKVVVLHRFRFSCSLPKLIASVLPQWTLRRRSFLQHQLLSTFVRFLSPTCVQYCQL